MEPKNYQEDLMHIRKMMERSSRFLSLSGLSGVFAGFTALLGAAYAFYVFNREEISYFDLERNRYNSSMITELFWVGLVVLVVAVACGYFFTKRKSVKNSQPIWDATAKQLLVHFATPLVVGGVVSLALIYHHLYVFIAPMMLIFYGLALVNAEKYTVTDVRYLGYCEIILGLICFFVLGWGLLFWAIGFGVLHIIYGLIMHKKYK